MFDLNHTKRETIIQEVSQLLEEFYANTENHPVSQDWNAQEVREYILKYDFNTQSSPEEVIKDIIQGLKSYTVHTTHAGYLGLFNPRAGFLSAIADYITAIFNPQLAAWSHSPYANTVERYIIEQFGSKFGYKVPSIDGTFCTGGAESNLTAVLCALSKHFPEYHTDGLMSLQQKPIIYCSSESHHSILRAARIAGLGANSVKKIPANEQLEMNLEILQQEIKADKRQGFYPLMIAATAGTTGSGAIDPLKYCAQIAKTNKMWLHVDAAYGGSAVILEEGKSWLKGIELSDSITLDLHKWFSLPMGISLYLTSHKDALHQTFRVSTAYMPKDGDQVEVIDPYIHSMQWSRRFMGLKIYLPLAVHGWVGFEETIAHQIHLGNQLRKLLKVSGWQIKNYSKLPIICFDHPDIPTQKIQEFVDLINQARENWVSVYPINGQPTIRACITNYNTSKVELMKFINLINQLKNTMSF